MTHSPFAPRRNSQDATTYQLGALLDLLGPELFLTTTAQLLEARAKAEAHSSASTARRRLNLAEAVLTLAKTAQALE